MGSILPPSDRERRLGRRSRSFCVSEPLKLSATIPPMTAIRPVPRRPPRLHRAHGRARPRRGRVPVGGAIRQPVAVGQPDAARPRPSPSAGGSVAPTAPASPADLSATYASIEDQVRTIRGLAAKKPVDPVVLDDAGIKKVTADGFRKDNPQALVDANERLLKGLGLLPQDANLGDLYVELLASRSPGCTPDDKKLYVVSRSGEIGPTEKITFAHEYTHALQDQNFDLGSLKLDEVGEGDQGDRAACRSSRATRRSLMSLWASAPQPGRAAAAPRRGAQRPEVSGSARRDARDPARDAAVPVHDRPDASSRRVQASGGWDAVDALFAEPPDIDRAGPPPREVRRRARRRSTVDASRRTSPTRLGDGWSRGARGHVRRVPARDLARRARPASGGPPPTPRRPAGAATGSRCSTARTAPGRSASTTAWDTDADAAEFAAAAQAPWSRALGDRPRSLPGAGGTARWRRDRRAPTTCSAGRGRPRPGRLGRARPRRLHRLGRGDPQQRRARWRASILRRAREREPRRRALRLVRVDDPRVAVEGVELRRQLGRVGGDAVRLLGRDRVLDDLREAGRSPGRARASGAPASSARDRRRRRQPGVGGLAQDRGDPGVRVLDVVDRVLGRLLLGQLDVEVDPVVAAA